MKFTTLTTALVFTAANVLADIVPVQLFVQSDDAALNGQALTSTHEGAGINYFFVDTNAQQLQYDEDNKQVFALLGGNIPDARQSLLVSGNVLQLTVAGAAEVTFDSDGVATFDGSDALYAAKNINDPYNYSNVRFAVVSYPEGGAPAGAIPFKIVGKFGEPEPETSSAAPEPETSTAPPTPETSSEVPVPTPTPAPAAAANVRVGSLMAVAGAAALLL
ncbi:Cell wall protein PGA30 [Spathaspora sp. JA1]|nr:Cell wall protein PGA30 [Spathaspora sp. JA1]